MRQAVFLDRDGVSNDAIVKDGKPFPPNGLGELRVSDGVLDACEALAEAGFLLVVVTNQPDVSRGATSKAAVEELHDYLKGAIGLEYFYTCFHDDADDCPCRKPQPGLLLTAAQDLNIDLASSFMVGDRWRDIEAGNTAGCRSIFVDHSYSEKQPQNYYSKVSSLLEAVHIILGATHERN